MQLYGQQWTRREIEARAGKLSQIGGVRRVTLSEGKEAGTEVIEVRTGAGLAFDIVPSKGLDVSLAQLWGSPISWQSPNGDVHPGHYEPEGTGFLRSASGGLLMTCGLSNAGSPSTDAHGNPHGQHGRIHHTPASQVSVRQEWNGDELAWEVSGVMEESAIFGSKLRLIRTIRGQIGANELTIADRVENFGFRQAPHMMLYHFNFGFPLLGERLEIHLPEADSRPRDGNALPLEHCTRWSAPDANHRESVYYHELRREAADSDGMAEVRLHNPAFPVGGMMRPVNVSLQWSAETLPLLVQWRMPGAGEHVLGIEPSNCRVEGLAAEAARGSLRVLEAGESVEYRLKLSIF